jgi:hypothetical protein
LIQVNAKLAHRAQGFTSFNDGIFCGGEEVPTVNESDIMGIFKDAKASRASA